jgi:hypothetical protein
MHRRATIGHSWCGLPFPPKVDPGQKKGCEETAARSLRRFEGKRQTLVFLPRIAPAFSRCDLIILRMIRAVNPETTSWNYWVYFNFLGEFVTPFGC